ncbi:MAG: SDR family oxidoreductase [Maribacter sp.]|nr:SDR family oxidoreductase [Maribacter sp.]NNK76369.1 SDR family oxidoreductase [Maribacter sp.]
MNRTVAIMGCGWLGLPLAKALLKDGFMVRGTTTSESKLEMLQNEGIVPFLISLSEEKIDGDISSFLINTEVLVINVPPKLRNGNKGNYVKKIQLLLESVKVAKTKKVIFVSSTSVYGNIEGEVTEETIPQPITESGKQLLAAENLFADTPELRTTIIRFGGLIGPDRHPVAMLSGRKGLTNGNTVINLIHLEDCIGIIRATIGNEWWGELFNGVYPFHPSKKEYYTNEALKRGLVIPQYSSSGIPSGKKIESRRLIHVKKYRFNTPF